MALEALATQHDETPSDLTSLQTHVLQTALELGWNAQIKTLAEAAGVSRPTFYRWLNESPAFRHAWENLWPDLLSLHMPAIIAAQISKAKRGDTPAARLCAEMAGAITHKLNISANDIPSEVPDLDEALREAAALRPWLRIVPEIEEAQLVEQGDE